MEKNDWRAELQYEVMEDLLRHVQLTHLAKDPVSYMEEGRVHIRKLEAFIATEIKKAREEGRREGAEAAVEYMKENWWERLQHGAVVEPRKLLEEARTAYKTNPKEV